MQNLRILADFTKINTCKICTVWIIRKNWLSKKTCKTCSLVIIVSLENINCTTFCSILCFHFVQQTFLVKENMLTMPMCLKEINVKSFVHENCLKQILTKHFELSWFPIINTRKIFLNCKNFFKLLICKNKYLQNA